MPHPHRPVGSVVAAAALAAGLLAGPLAARAQLVFSCAAAGSDCTAELTDGGNAHVSTIDVPGAACAAVGAVRVRLAVRHDWVGDLRATLAHGGRTVMLLDRPGRGAELPYGCPGHDADVTLDESAADDVQQACAVTIPALDGPQHSRGHRGRLQIAPNSPPFSLAGCPFERYDGAFVGLQQGDDIVPAPYCPFPFDDDTGGAAPCLFRGRWNDACGNANLLVRVISDGDLVRLRLLNVGQVVEFRGTGPEPQGLDLDLLQIGNQVLQRDGDAFLQLGLQALAGLPCGGEWTLRIVDAAAPNRGRLTEWSLEIDPQNTPTATRTPTATATRTPTTSASATASATRTPTATPTITTSATASPTTVATATATATPSQPATQTRTVEPTQTPTGGVTETPTSTPPETPESPTTTPSVPATETPPTHTPTSVPPACTGDCNGDGTVVINELVLGVTIALGRPAAEPCAVFDADASGTVEINELIAAVRYALEGCPA